MKQPRKTKKRRKGMMILGGCILLLLLIGGAAVGAFIFPYAASKMDMTLLDIPRTCEPSILYAYMPENRADRCGELHIAEHSDLLQSRPHIRVTYDEIPPDLIHAFVAIEDKRFYRHKGIDPIRTAKAGLGYITGRPACGGSTITQQLVKNLTGRTEQTPDRKLTEIFTALDLERRTDKTAILEAYLNIINLAEGCFGVGMASETYFQKSVSELTLPECATIAAITSRKAAIEE